jgi:hypothetical protein
MKIKQILPVICCLFAMVSFPDMTHTIAQTGVDMRGSGSETLITVLNPAVASRMADRVPLAPRPDSLAGKTIYMVAINWGGTEAALNVFEEMRSWFSRSMPEVQTLIKIKKGGYDADDPDLWKEIGEKGTGAILGVSG